MTLASRLTEAGFAACTPSAAVISVRAPSPEAAVEWAGRCREEGVVVGCFRPPSVPDKVSRLRLTVRADLTEADLDRAVRTITEAAPSGARR
jgi:8-amino-7-oxononanoate synthase